LASGHSYSGWERGYDNDYRPRNEHRRHAGTWLAMSLAPAEQRALDRIEFALYGSDRRLAHTLSRFKLPLAHGGLTMMVRKPRRLKQVIVAAIVVTLRRGHEAGTAGNATAK
jgi:hypothetical protein